VEIIKSRRKDKTIKVLSQFTGMESFYCSAFGNKITMNNKLKLKQFKN